MQEEKVTMRPKFALIIACALISSCADSAGASNILQLYDYHGDEVKASARQAWLGLYNGSNGKATLKPAKVSITIVHDAIVDQTPTEKTGKRISVAGKEKPTFIFSGIPELKAGNVIATSVTKDHMSIKDTFKIKVGATQATLTAKAKEIPKDKEFVSNYTITLESGGVRQQLYYKEKVCIEYSPSLMWCGDLDGDGKVDLIIDVATDGNSSDVTLFLSSKAKNGKLVKEAAHQLSTGC